jgi:hypothetical protein
MTVNIKIADFWNVMGCKLVYGYQHFGEPCSLHLQGRRKRKQPLSSTLIMEAACSCQMLISILGNLDLNVGLSCTKHRLLHSELLNYQEAPYADMPVTVAER